ncbi:MAG: 4-phosphopantetheinyl transferase family protein [Deltaproteobacteria bacterium]|nr:4-phosphopantetheinyl transferase family protein [Deltaproteobacteria bacterium]
MEKFPDGKSWLNFYRIWTAKEALLKTSGMGLREPILKPPVGKDAGMKTEKKRSSEVSITRIIAVLKSVLNSAHYDRFSVACRLHLTGDFWQGTEGRLRSGRLWDYT